MKTWAFWTMYFLSQVGTFPLRKSQVSWLWKRTICISFWLSVSWYPHTHWSFFSSFLAKVKHMLLRKVFHQHFSGGCLVYLSTKQNVKGLYFYKSNYISKHLIIYHAASCWIKMLFSAWLLEVMICIYKSVKYSNIYLYCLIWENNSHCWNTWRLDSMIWHASFQISVFIYWYLFTYTHIYFNIRNLDWNKESS